MDIQEKQQQPHFALLPFMAQGHMIPMIDIARLLAKQGVTVTILITPYNHNRFKSVIDRAVSSGLSIRISHLKFLPAESGLPEACENIDMASTFEESVKFMIATSTLEDQVEQILRNLDPRPSCLISDMCYPWSANVALKLRVPRLVFTGTSCFSLTCLHVMGVHKGFPGIASLTEYFVVPDIPDRIEITKVQMTGTPSNREWGELWGRIHEANAKSFGTVANTFEELEPEYAKEYSRAKGKKVWCVGPVSLCNEDELDKAERGNKASVDEHACLKWLDSQKKSSVIYVCLGSLSSVSTSQLMELGLGLKKSGRPFVWVIRNAKEELLSELEKLSERGLVIHGWAPQVLLLSHPSVGGFLTHCGWNSTLEGVTAGLPMMTWPLFTEQFWNEKFVVNVIKTGVRAGVEVPDVAGDEEKVGVQVKSDGIEAAIEKLMDGGEQGEERRERARKLGELAKRATEEAGSSCLNLREEYLEYQGVEEAHYAYRVRDRLRKEVLVPLRKALELPEVYMGANDWGSLPYNRVASVAMQLYKEKFHKHDEERFKEYLEKVRKGEAKIAAGALFPHQIIASLGVYYDSDNDDWDQVAELQWKRMVDDMAMNGKLSNCLAICDVSDSMSGTPMDVSVALGILASELSEEPWKGKLITFSANPELQMVEGSSLKEKAGFVKRMEWGMNTDFQKVFDLILEVAVNGKLKPEEMIKTLFVFSDMEFDQANGTKQQYYGPAPYYNYALPTMFKRPYYNYGPPPQYYNYGPGHIPGMMSPPYYNYGPPPQYYNYGPGHIPGMMSPQYYNCGALPQFPQYYNYGPGHTPGMMSLQYYGPAHGAGTSWETDYQAIVRKFTERGYGDCVPEIVFWNLRDSKATPVPSNQAGVALVSGFSKNLMKLFLKGEKLEPEAIMNAAISRRAYEKLVVLD